MTRKTNVGNVYNGMILAIVGGFLDAYTISPGVKYLPMHKQGISYFSE